jgi:hypothetical protein
MDERIGIGARLRAGLARAMAGLGSLFQGAERWTARGARTSILMAVVAIVAVVAIIGVAHAGFEHVAGVDRHERHQAREGWRGHGDQGRREAGTPAGRTSTSTSGGGAGSSQRRSEPAGKPEVREGRGVGGPQQPSAPR